jgi:hypothetical protein
MPGLKISQLPVADPLTGDELLAVVQAGVTSQTTVSDASYGQVTVSLTAQDVYDSVDTPIELLPAPGVGHMWLALTCFMHLAPSDDGVAPPSDSAVMFQYGDLPFGYKQTVDAQTFYINQGGSELVGSVRLLNLNNFDLYTIPQGRYLRQPMRDTSTQYENDYENDAGGYLPLFAFNGPVTLVGNAPLGFRIPSAVTVVDGGTGYDDVGVAIATFTDPTTGRVSSFQVDYTATGGVVDSATVSSSDITGSNGIWLAAENETFTLLQSGDGSATITIDSLAAYTAMDFGTDNELLVNLKAVKVPVA